MDFGNRPRLRTRNFDDSLVGFEFNDAVISGNFIAFMHQDMHDVATRDIFTQLG